MALTQRLEFRQSQSLVMTPQLMQAIKLLQLSNLDLSAFVEEELERNPLLERGSECRESRCCNCPISPLRLLWRRNGSETRCSSAPVTAPSPRWRAGPRR